MIADKTKTIKNATDQELDALLIRLRKESEAQNIISSIKRNSSGAYDYYNSSENAVSTETPIDDLYHDGVEEVLAHFGVPGMKWGHKKGTSVDLHAKRQAKMKKHAEKKEFKKEYSQMQKDTLRHPVISAKEQFGLLKNNPRKALNLDLKTAKDLNKRVADRVANKKEQSEEYTKSRELKAKSSKSLTNKELKALNERMQLERNLRDLKSNDMQKGLDVIKTITAAGTTVASLYALSTTPAGQAVKKIITKKLGAPSV